MTEPDESAGPEQLIFRRIDGLPIVPFTWIFPATRRSFPPFCGRTFLSRD